jgi:hypothetical protein
LEADGPDAEEATNALTGLIERGFDELPTVLGAEISQPARANVEGGAGQMADS